MISWCQIFQYILITGSGLGRRASDGGANLQMYFQRQFEGGWSHPNSQEQITQVIWDTQIICYNFMRWN